MSRDINDIYKEIIKTNKEVNTVENNLSKDINEMGRLLKNMDKKLNQILSKMLEFEIVFDAMEEEENEDDDDEEDWTPYDEEYEAEDYEKLNDDDGEYENGQSYEDFG
jgi:hypothetical protein